MNENVLEVVSAAMRYNKVPVTHDTITESLKSHPQYPSLKSVCDSLKEWKVEHYPMKLEKEELKEAGTTFIAHLKDKGETLAFVPGINGNSTVEYFDNHRKSKKISEGEFFDRYTGVAILIDVDETSGEEGYSGKRQFELLHKGLPYLAGLAILLSVANAFVREVVPGLSISYFSLLVAKLIGLCFSIMLVSQDLNIKNSLTDALCGIGRKTNCNSILNTNAARLFAWVHWSDIGVVYFLSGLIMINYADIKDFSLMAILSIGALGYAIYSIYYQAVIAKTWCPLCLSIQAIFVAEVALSYTYVLPLQVSWISVFKFGIIVMTTTVGMVLYKAYYTFRQISKSDRLAHLRFKRNPGVFINLLKQNRRKQFDIPEEIFTVSKGASGVIVTAFLSLNCNPCKKAFNQLKKLFENEEITIHMIVSFHERNKGLVNQIARLIQGRKQNEAMNLLESWYNNGNDIPEDTNENLTEDCYERLNKVHQQLFKNAEITGTPTTFVNGYKLPMEYEIKDIAYFIDVLKQ